MAGKKNTQQRVPALLGGAINGQQVVRENQD